MEIGARAASTKPNGNANQHRPPDAQHHQATLGEAFPGEHPGTEADQRDKPDNLEEAQPGNRKRAQMSSQLG